MKKSDSMDIEINNNKLLSIRNLSLKYHRKEILHDINLDIEKNTITAIIGQSGCGKTTLLKTINRFTYEEGAKINGDIYLYNTFQNKKGAVNINNIPLKILRSKIGMVFQTPVAFPFSIEKNITSVLKFHGENNSAKRVDIMVDNLKKVNLYDEVCSILKKSAETLSGGQKQRLAIARSLCINPSILLLDEPCSALDTKNTIEIEKTLLQLKNDITFVIVTHNLSQAKRIADKIVFMDSGNIIEISEKNTFFKKPKSDLARELVKYNL